MILGRGQGLFRGLSAASSPDHMGFGFAAAWFLFTRDGCFSCVWCVESVVG